MVCQICMKNPAYIHIPKIVNNAIVLIHLCRDCANDNKSHELSNGLDDKLQILVDGLLGVKDQKKNTLSRPVCNTCGTTIKDVKKKKLLGCPHCYDIFYEYLSENFNVRKKVFTRPGIPNETTEQLKRMKKELKKSVEGENFEKAALLRDKIRKCEKEGFFSEY